MAEYIEREALKAEFTGNFRDDYSTNLIKAIIDTQPAADVAEVRHGKWIVDEYKYYRCSECGYEHDSPEYITLYCPNCGARMDLGDDEE